MVSERFELAFYRACILLQIRPEMYEITFTFSSVAWVPLQDKFSNLIDSVKKGNFLAVSNDDLVGLLPTGSINLQSHHC